MNQNDVSARTQQIVLGVYGAGATVGLLHFSREQEAEADHIGLLYTARANYDPHAAIGFWQKMAQQSAGSAPPVFLSDHPSDASRISALQAEMPQAEAEYQKAQYGQ
jgi:predicted Zn-dependent protease